VSDVVEFRGGEQCKAKTLVVLGAVAILGASSAAVARGGGGHGMGMHGYGHSHFVHHFNFRRNFVSASGEIRSSSVAGVGVAIGVGAAMATPGAATPLLSFSRKQPRRRQLAQLTLRPVIGNSRSSQFRPQRAERNQFRS
jgi:hypothetical protein